MKALKWVLIAAGAVVLALAAALAFIAATFDPNQYKTQAATFVKDKTQRTLTIEGDIRLMLFPKLGIHLGKTRLSEVRGETVFANLDDMRISLALIPLLSRQIVIDEVRLAGLRANLVKQKDGRTNFDDLLGGDKKSDGKSNQASGKPAEPAKAPMPVKLEIEGVTISSANLTWKDQMTGATYEISDFDLKTGRVAPGIPTRFSLGAAVRANEPKLDLKIGVEGLLTAELERQLFSVAELSVKVNGQAAGRTGLAAQLSGSAGADLQKHSANADVALKIMDSNIKAKLAVEDFAAMRSTFDITIDKLNVDQFMPAKKAGETAGTPAGPQPEQPIDFSPIKKLDVKGSVRIGELIAQNIKAQNVRLELMAKHGRLDLEPLTADLYQGSVKGMASIDANANRIVIKQTLAGISIGPLLRDATQHDLLDGRGSVALDVTTTGTLVTALKKALNGTARIELKDGAIKGIDVAQSLRKAKALLVGGTSESDQAAATGGKTDFSELTASFIIKNGVAHNSDLLAKSPFLRLTGEGDINIPDSSLNYLVKASVVASSAGQGGQELAELQGLTVPVRASGPFTALKYKVEVGSVLGDSAKQKLNEKKEQMKKNLEDQLKSKLLRKPGESPSDGGEPAAGHAAPPPAKPEDKLKEKLKKLF
ncbi:MAG TPA: AsmA family protein [Burkholderiales bacterium]|nr:AsmA family protein [Burkholderiales bacterium]